MATANTSSDNDTMAALQAALTSDNNNLKALNDQYSQASLDLNNATAELNNTNNIYSDVFNRAAILQSAHKWGGRKVSSENMPGPEGDYYYVSPHDSQIWAYTNGYNVLNQQYTDGANAQASAQTKINTAQSTLLALKSADGKTGKLVESQNAVNQDIQNIANFVPTTVQGQQDHAAAIQAAQSIASANAVTTTNAAAAKAADANAAIAKVNFASVNTQYLIWGGIGLTIIIITGIIIVKFRKKA